LHFFETGNFPSELSRERLAEDPFDKNMVIP